MSHEPPNVKDQLSQTPCLIDGNLSISTDTRMSLLILPSHHTGVFVFQIPGGEGVFMLLAHFWGEKLCWFELFTQSGRFANPVKQSYTILETSPSLDIKRRVCWRNSTLNYDTPQHTHELVLV